MCSIPASFYPFFWGIFVYTCIYPIYTVEVVVGSMAGPRYISAAVIALAALAVAAPTPLARRGLFSPSGRSLE